MPTTTTATATHSPGPWVAKMLRYNWQVKSGVRVVAKVGVSSTGSIAQDEADARLIAAAPDLLAVLEDAVRLLDTWNAACGPAGEEHHFKVETYRAAIAKAKGGT